MQSLLCHGSASFAFSGFATRALEHSVISLVSPELQFNSTLVLQIQEHLLMRLLQPGPPISLPS
jgi:hypothetical protein